MEQKWLEAVQKGNIAYFEDTAPYDTDAIERPSMLCSCALLARLSELLSTESAEESQNSFFFEVLQAHCLQRGKPYVITPPQWGVLALLSHHERQTIGMLAQQLKVDGPAVTNIVKRLEQSGLLERARDRQDERVVEDASGLQRCLLVYS